MFSLRVFYLDKVLEGIFSMWDVWGRQESEETFIYAFLSNFFINSKKI
jgi:hypothetical protein